MAGRIFARIALALAFVAALAVPAVAFAIRGPEKPETWLVAASALAVVTSVVSTWSSRRVVELQEDAKRPTPYPSFDVTSRYGLALIRVTNTGGTAAHDVCLHWDRPLHDHKGEVVGFAAQEHGRAPISVLLPGESIAKTIGAHHEFIAKHPDAEYSGRIEFRDPSRRKYVSPFRLDGRQLAETLTYDHEAPRTHYELQRVPGELEQIRGLLKRLLDRLNGPPPSNSA